MHLPIRDIRELISHQATYILNMFNQLNGNCADDSGPIDRLFKLHCGPTFNLKSQLHEIVERILTESDKEELQKVYINLHHLPE